MVFLPNRVRISMLIAALDGASCADALPSGRLAKQVMVPSGRCAPQAENINIRQEKQRIHEK